MLPVVKRYWQIPAERYMHLHAVWLCKKFRHVPTTWLVAFTVVIAAYSSTMVPSNRFCSPYGTILKRKRCKTEVWHQVFLRSPLGVKEWVWVLMQSPGQGKEQIHHWLLGELAFPTPSWCLGYLGLESYHEFERHFFGMRGRQQDWLQVDFHFSNFSSDRGPLYGCGWGFGNLVQLP